MKTRTAAVGIYPGCGGFLLLRWGQHATMVIDENPLSGLRVHPFGNHLLEWDMKLRASAAAIVLAATSATFGGTIFTGADAGGNRT